MDNVESIDCAVDTHSVDGGERGTEREVHIFPHTRQTAGPADHSGGAGAQEYLARKETLWSLHHRILQT